MKLKKLLCRTITLIFVLFTICGYLPTHAIQREKTVAVINYPNGDVYSGEQISGRPEGNGTMLWSNGDKYIGEFKDGLMHGQGLFIWADGDRYKGEFKDGKRSGQGVMIWNNGDVYKGQFFNGEMNGQGTMEWITGNKYTGEFKNGTITGYGTMTYPDGSRLDGLWEKGILVNPAISPPTGLRINAFSEGQIQVGWNPVANADYYHVYYSYSYNGPYYCLTDRDGKKTAYGWNSSYSAVIINIPCNTTIYIKVTAVKNGIESEYSSIASATTPGKYYEYYSYSYWYPYGYPYDYLYYYPYNLVVESNIYGYYTGGYYNEHYILANGQVWRQICNTHINTSIYMPRVLIYYINGNYVMWIDGVDHYIYVKQVR